ncbi:MAG: GGDEF domain-containing protein [Verrucomicrobia bacterium]|nr:GGDEF domain-containing protein [Verrucomicrobiota bacterium]
MLSLSPHLILMQLPLLEAGQLIVVMGIAFIIITLIASTSRFHTMIQLSEDQLTTVDDCNDFFFIQVTRYLSKINRTASGFIVLVVQFQTDQADWRPVQEQLLQKLKNLIRSDCDKACLFREDCVAAIIDASEERLAEVVERTTRDLKQIVTGLPNVSVFRTGASCFPLHGLNTQMIIDTATDALEQADFESSLPLCIAPSPEQEEGTEEKSPSQEDLGEISREDKNAALDPLTGVLKPESVASYMRKYLAELRREKKPAVLLCIGINRIDNIISLHGETAADEVIAGVSRLVQKLTRNCDLIGRYHRDDFVVMAPCTLEEGEKISRRIREAIQKEVFLFEGKRLKASVGIGITAHPEHGRNLRDLFRGAYTALEIIRGWNTSSCLVYDPAQHSQKKINHEPTP